MANPQRPNSVPENAVWNSSYKYWSAGKEKGGIFNRVKKKTGLWTHWDKQGNVIFEGNYNDDGNLGGLSKYYHSNGKVAKEGNYKNGKEHGLFQYEKIDQNATQNFPRVYNHRIMKAKVLYHMGNALQTYYYLADGKKADIYARTLPKGVHPDAWWNNSNYEWEHGTHQDNKLVGSYTAWRWDGKKAREHNYNASGQLHGTVKRYHTDGTLARVGEYVNGKEQGDHTFLRSHNYTQEYFMNNVHKRVWKKIETYHNGTVTLTHYFNDKDQRCSKKGFALIDADVNDLFDGQPVDFLSGNFEEFLNRYTGGKVEAIDRSKKEERERLFRDFWGVSLPQDLSMAFDLFERADSPRLFNYFDSATPKLAQLQDWKNAGQNIVEQAVLHSQESFPFDYMMDWITGSVALDALLQNPEQSYYSYSFHYGLLDDKAAGQIYLHRHQSYSYWGITMEAEFAKDLSSFLYMMSMFCAYGEYEIMTEQKFTQNHPKLNDKIRLPHYFLGNFQVGRNRLYESAFRYSSRNKVCVDNFNRAKWILEILRGETDINTIRYQRPKYPVIANGELKNLTTTIQTHVADAFYYLFGTFFSKEQKYLFELIEACKESPAQIIKDAALLVEQLSDGRKGVGIVTDVHHLRQELVR